MAIILMNSKNSKTSDPHRLFLNLADKINLKRNDEYVALSYLNMIIFCIRYSRFFLNNLKKHREKTDHLSIRTHVNEIENRVSFKMKTGCYIGLLTPEMMKLLGRTKIK